MSQLRPTASTPVFQSYSTSHTDYPGSRFVIFSLARTGSTTLALLLNCHKHITCFIEPFNPDHYKGQYHQLAVKSSVETALETLWPRCNGFKHVWYPDGWPFREKPSLTRDIVLNPQYRILFLLRRNLLQRVVSNMVSEQLDFWFGTRAEYARRISNAKLTPLDPELVRGRIQSDVAAMKYWHSAFEHAESDVMTLHYEDFYAPESTDTERLAAINAILTFLRFERITAERFKTSYADHITPHVHKWATPDIYSRIPGIDLIEGEVGSDETGWLFRKIA